MRGPIRVEGRAGWWWPRENTVNEVSSPGAGGRFSLIAADARLCVNLLEQSSLGFFPCAGFEIDRWHGEGNATLTRKTSTALWGASFSGAALLINELGPYLALRVSLETAVPVNPPAFGFIQDGRAVEVFRPNRVAIRLGAGLELRFR